MAQLPQLHLERIRGRECSPMKGGRRGQEAIVGVFTGPRLYYDSPKMSSRLSLPIALHHVLGELSPGP